MASSSTSDRRTTLQRRTPLTLKTSCTDGFRQASIKATSKAVKGDFCSSLKHSKDTLSGLLLEHGHDTEECHDFKNQIKDLIRHEHLHRYVRDQRTPPKGRPTRDSSPHPKGPIEKQIDIIVGGPASGGDSSSARKAYAWSTVEKRPKCDRDPEITFGTGNEA
ncbi:hypothetical protein BHM03_00062117 [Ensete ventricosum]|nr:hypothetical protein BHM03_00062117 [Ensete ventricosum]